ncbi:hypothetical protein BU15DRAFT_84171 [Melanogaster broomeanus]|nr:hypothetical protein BU15DRAFT_84171 [Melanogaster broomeanus]
MSVSRPKTPRKSKSASPTKPCHEPTKRPDVARPLLKIGAKSYGQDSVSLANPQIPLLDHAEDHPLSAASIDLPRHSEPIESELADGFHMSEGIYFAPAQILGGHGNKRARQWQRWRDDVIPALVAPYLSFLATRRARAGVARQCLWL